MPMALKYAVSDTGALVAIDAGTDTALMAMKPIPGGGLENLSSSVLQSMMEVAMQVARAALTPPEMCSGDEPIKPPSGIVRPDGRLC